MEIHTACQSADAAAGDAGSYYTTLGFWGWTMEMEMTVMASWFRTQLQDLSYLFIWRISGDANGDAVAPAAWDAAPAPGTTVVGLLASAMGNGEGSLPPASSSPCRGPCLLTNNAGEGWQWSQWREPRIPKRYTVSFEGRSWL